MSARSAGENLPVEFEGSTRPDEACTGTLERRSFEDDAVVRTDRSTPVVGRQGS